MNIDELRNDIIVNQKKALLIGGSGGLSSVLACMVMKYGYEVWTVTRGLRKLPDGVNAIIADRNNIQEFEHNLLAENTIWDVVFDCICMNKEHAKQDLQILSAVTKRLIVVSTDSVYSPHHKKTPQNEDGIFLKEEGPDETVSYGCNKRRMEEVFLKEMDSERASLNITVFRPGHIYGPGFHLGCFPENSRQPNLPQHILDGKPVKLVGMGTYLIHPIYVDDLAEVMIECADNEKTYQEIFCIGGPESIESRMYYEEIANALGVGLQVEEVPLKGYLEKHPEYSGHLCHRQYDLTKLAETGIKLPGTHLADGIRKTLHSKNYC